MEHTFCKVKKKYADICQWNTEIPLLADLKIEKYKGLVQKTFPWGR